MPWQRERIGDHPVDYFVPQERTSRFPLIWLHDIGQTPPVNDAVWTPLFEQAGLACIAPWGEDSWWSSRKGVTFGAHATSEAYLLAELLPWIQSRHPGPLGLAGIGMGGQGALRWGFKHPQRFPVVGALSAAIDHHELHGRGSMLDHMYDSREPCRQDTAPMHVHPSRQPLHLWFSCPHGDFWYRGNDRLHEKLMALGVAHQCDLTTTSDDYLRTMSQRLIDFVMDGLERMIRKLL